MLSFLNQIDTNIFLFLNSLHLDFLDPIMLTISYDKRLILVLILGLSIYGYTKLKKFYFLAFFFCLIGFGLSDSISSRILKPGFERFRPCHNPELKSRVYLAGKNCWGGKFGFVSSHAANSFSIALFFWLLFRKNHRAFGFLFVYAGIVSYSRIYLARHYPGDILFGTILGLITGYLSFRAYQFVSGRLKQPSLNPQ